MSSLPLGFSEHLRCVASLLLLEGNYTIIVQAGTTEHLKMEGVPLPDLRECVRIARAHWSHPSQPYPDGAARNWCYLVGPQWRVEEMPTDLLHSLEEWSSTLQQSASPPADIMRARDTFLQGLMLTPVAVMLLVDLWRDAR